MTPTQRRFDAIWEIGCIACRKLGYCRRTQAHHQNLGAHAGQKQLGDMQTVGLCPWHHVGECESGYCADEMTIKFGPSMKHQSVAFREKFGSDEELLAYQNQLIDEWMGTFVCMSNRGAA